MVRETDAVDYAVIRQRLEHLVGEIGNALKELGFTGPVGRQVVLTGGGAEAVAERLPMNAPWPAGIAGVEVQPDLVLQGLAVMAAASRDGLRHY